MKNKMKLKTAHLRELMAYIDDEMPDELDHSYEENGFAVSFSFEDKEKRECKIVIYESTLNKQNPRLIKSMELRTRLPKKTDGDK